MACTGMTINLTGALRSLERRHGDGPTEWTGANGLPVHRREAMFRLRAALDRGERIWKMGRPCPTWDAVQGKCRCDETGYDPLALGC